MKASLFMKDSDWLSSVSPLSPSLMGPQSLFDLSLSLVSICPQFQSGLDHWRGQRPPKLSGAPELHRINSRTQHLHLEAEWTRFIEPRQT